MATLDCVPTVQRPRKLPRFYILISMAVEIHVGGPIRMVQLLLAYLLHTFVEGRS